MTPRALAVLGLLAAGCPDLWHAWGHDPFVTAGLPAAALWLAAVLRSSPPGARGPAPASIAAWRTAAVVLAVLARLVDVHALAHAALAAWLCAASNRRALLAAASASWIPLATQPLSALAPLGCNAVRLAVAAAALTVATTTCLDHAGGDPHVAYP